MLNAPSHRALALLAELEPHLPPDQASLTAAAAQGATSGPYAHLGKAYGAILALSHAWACSHRTKLAVDPEVEARLSTARRHMLSLWSADELSVACSAAAQEVPPRRLGLVRDVARLLRYGED